MVPTQHQIQHPREQLTRLRTSELGAHVGERVRVAGWLHARRRLGGLTFLTLRDGWGLVQVVAEGAAAAALDPGPPAESVIAIEGVVTRSAQAPGGLEITAPTVEVIAAATVPPPVALGKRELKAGLATLLDTAVVTNRHPARRAVFRLAAAAMAGFRATLLERDFTEIQTPKLLAAATESGASVFPVDYFGRTAFLAQSPQLYKQMMVGVFERVFEVGPVFRAEPHDTTRHLNEYVSLDAEMGFITDHHDIMALLRDAVAGMVGAMRARAGAELDLLGVALPEVPATIPEITFVEAHELILARHGVDVRGELDLSPRDERWLGDWAREERGSDFLYVTGYPTRKVAFYAQPNPEHPEYANYFDLIFRGTEMVSGGQRRHRYEDYLAVLAERGLPAEPFAAYLDAFRYGMPPHGGFGLGLERFVMQVTGLPTIKLVSLFPRDLHRLTP
ncbi:MAG TPA: aspartate--tRNA(Asn) ligase [Ktedonobacterales bacterium]